MTPSDSQSFAWRAMAVGALFLGTAAFPARSAQAAAATATHAVGAWDLTLDNGARQCRMMLRADLAPAGYAVGMPVGCHLAFPFLASIRAWQEAGDGNLRLEDGQGQPVVSFDSGADGTLKGIGPAGEALLLKMVGPHRPMVLRTAAAGETASKTAAVKAAPKLALPTVAEAAGHYAVLRKEGRDTGCMVTLDEKARGPGGSLKANLAPACRDQGIVIFDPVGWQFQGGQLVLTARKGHTTKLDLQPDGTWTKPAKDGVSISLKRM